MQIVRFRQHEFIKFYESPHRTYSLLRYPTNLDVLSRITLCQGKRFENGFITYIGCKNESDTEDMINLVEQWNGYFRQKERYGRPSDRLFYRDRSHYPLELKARRLTLPDVIEIAEHWNN